MVSEGEPLVIDSYLKRAVDRSAADVAVCDRTRELSYSDLDDRVSRLANGLGALGTAYGDRVALLMQNSLEMAVGLLAAQRIGAIAAPINIRLARAEIEYILADLQPTALLIDSTRVGGTWSYPASLRAVVVVGDRYTYAEPEAVNLAPSTTTSFDFEVLLASSDSARPLVQVDGRDAAYILYTSGTTGRPKGAVLSHAGYVASSLAVLNAMRMVSRDELRHIGVPMFHSGGLNSMLQQVVLGGSSIITEPGGLPADEVVDLWERHEVFTAFLTPTQWRQVCELPGIGDRKLRLGRLIWGSSTPPPDLVRRMQAQFAGLPVYANFGMTETSGTTFSLPPEQAASKSHTVGRPVGPIQVRIVDDKMRDVRDGVVGEVVYQGPSVLTEYWRDKPATDRAFTGGWFHSGDLGFLDEDGFLVLVGRLKDMIVSGGENIYSSEVEAALATHPAVAEVAVVGVPHPKWVETPCAIVVPTDPSDPPTLAELQQHIAPILASYKKPTSLRVVSSLPRNTMGKVLRGQLKDDQLNRSAAGQ